MEIKDTLAERRKRYGSFVDNSTISQKIKETMRASPNWANLSTDKKECLEMIAYKISRLLTGDPEYHDNWHDIEGYARLVADEILRKQKEPDQIPLFAYDPKPNFENFSYAATPKAGEGPALYDADDSGVGVPDTGSGN